MTAEQAELIYIIHVRLRGRRACFPQAELMRAWQACVLATSWAGAGVASMCAHILSVRAFHKLSWCLRGKHTRTCCPQEMLVRAVQLTYNLKYQWAAFSHILTGNIKCACYPQAELVLAWWACVRWAGACSTSVPVFHKLSWCVYSKRACCP